MQQPRQFEAVRRPPRFTRKNATALRPAPIFPIVPSSASVQVLLKSAAQELCCVICFDVLRDPVLLECRHGFCRECISRMMEDDTDRDDKKRKQDPKAKQKCPLCKAPTQTRSLTSSEVLTAIVSTISRISDLSGVDDMSDTQQVSGVHSQAFALHYAQSSSGDVVEVTGGGCGHAFTSTGGDGGGQSPTSSTLIADRLFQSLQVNGGSVGLKRQRDHSESGAGESISQSNNLAEEDFTPTPIAAAENGGGISQANEQQQVGRPPTTRHITFQSSSSTPSPLTSSSSLQHLPCGSLPTHSDPPQKHSLTSPHSSTPVLLDSQREPLLFSDSANESSSDSLTVVPTATSAPSTKGSAGFDILADLLKHHSRTTATNINDFQVGESSTDSTLTPLVASPPFPQPSSLVAPLHFTASTTSLTLTPPRWRCGQDTDSDNSNSWGGNAQKPPSASHLQSQHPTVDVSTHSSVRFPPPPPLPPTRNSQSIQSTTSTIPLTQHLNILPISANGFERGFPVGEEQSSVLPTQPLQFQSKSINAAAPSQYTGRCALCGLDTSNRAQMRKFLRSILSKDPTCRRSDIIGLSEQSARELFGPLLTFADHLGKGAVTCHRLCLLWTHEVSVVPADSQSEGVDACDPSMMDGVTDAVNVSYQRRCRFCNELGASLQASIPSQSGVDEDSQRSGWFHIPCALLTGSGVCCTTGEAGDEELSLLQN